MNRSASPAFNKWIRNEDNKIIGFDCPYHGEKLLYANGAAFETTDGLLCPSCGGPICPECANTFDVKPSDVGESLDYLIGSQNGMAKAYCGQCGDFGYAYTLQYLKLVGCELPEDYEDYNRTPETFKVVASARVACLTDLTAITREVTQKFVDGQRGIIKYEHDTGEIWGIPENVDGEWLLTLCYPEER